MIYSAIVFLPGLGALIVGLFGRLLGRPSVRADHDRAPRRLLPALLAGAVARRLRARDGARRHRAVDHLGRARRLLGVPHRHADCGDVRRRDDGVGARPRLLDRLHGRGPLAPALLCLSVGLQLRHADAGDGRQPGAAVLRLGGRRPLLLPADRVLVPEARGERGGHQGVRREPRRRLRLRARHLRHLHRVPHGEPRPDLRCRAGDRRADVRVPRLPGRYPDDAVPVAVHGGDGQVGAVPAAHLAARRHGGPDAGLRADPRRHHGDRRRVHGGAAVAALRARSRRARVRDARSAPSPPSSRRPSASSRTTSSGSSPIRPARSSATCSSPAASAPTRPASSTCSRTRSSRRCCSSAPAR